MLTGDLVRVQQKGSTLYPSFVDPNNSNIQEVASTLLTLFQRALSVGSSRHEIEEQIDWFVADRRDHKMVRGLAKVMFDRSTFESAFPIEPMELRDRVFTRAAEMGPLALGEDPLERPTAQAVYRDLSTELGLPPDVLEKTLYADLKSAQLLIELRVPDAEWLIHRYNVALVQALLLKSESIRITLQEASPQRLRQLFRQIKFHQLIHHISLSDDGRLHIQLDGPTSLFRQSTRYGMQLANFFPTLLLQTVEWEMVATLRWTRRKLRKTVTLHSTVPLVSHYRDQGGYLSREQQWFKERFDALDTEWVLEEGRVPVDLNGRAVLLPDFIIRKGEQFLQLEILGFWRHEALEKKLALINKYGPKNWLIAISRKRGTSKTQSIGLEGPILEFAEVLPPKKVIQFAEALSP